MTVCNALFEVTCVSHNTIHQAITTSDSDGFLQQLNCGYLDECVGSAHCSAGKMQLCYCTRLYDCQLSVAEQYNIASPEIWSRLADHVTSAET